MVGKENKYRKAGGKELCFTLHHVRNTTAKAIESGEKNQTNQSKAEVYSHVKKSLVVGRSV